MTRISLGPLVHSTLGFDRFFEEVERMLDTSDIKPVAQNFPPHNILKLDDNRYVVELAVAGFSKDEIEITVADGNLTIKGVKADKNEGLYIHKGIGTRSFTKTIKVADTIEVKGAEYKDGILRIGLENIVPESKKPRKIEIDNELKEFKPQLLQEKKAA